MAVKPKPGETVREFAARGGRFDEDLTTPEYQLHMPRRSTPGQLIDDFARDFARGLIDLSPGVRVRLGSTAFASMVLARSRMPAVLAIFTAVGFGYAAERAYAVVHDVHKAAIAIAAAADDPFTSGTLPGDPPRELCRPGSPRAARGRPRPDDAGNRSEEKYAERRPVVRQRSFIQRS